MTTLPYLLVSKQADGHEIYGTRLNYECLAVASKKAAFVRALNGQSFSIGCEHEQRWMAEQIYIYRTYLFRQWTIKCIAISSVKYKSKLSCYQFFQKTNEKIMPRLARSNFYKYIFRSFFRVHNCKQDNLLLKFPDLCAQLNWHFFLFADTTPNVVDE